MISRLLIANRGEIAVRVIRACAEMGVRSVAVYSKADRNALHVKKADEAFSVGDDPLAGYLDAHKIVNLAVERKCDAIHPGYGFLSENPLLAKLCRRLGVRFVGPPAEVIAQMGDKVAAREAMKRAGVPVVQGSDGPAHNAEDAARVAAQIGYPVMLKAVAGGGGRGIRACENESETRRNFARVASEAGKSFGNPAVFVEKRVRNPRHIEVQVLADDYGGGVHLFERDCSIQRRNQKLIEIAPSPQLSEALREKICDAAVRAARAANYRNAGTVEFLLDEDGDFRFLEMNTRLQVEHPVSEQITGVDIVQEQIRVASGRPLSVAQDEIGFRGYAMELRVNAEDPAKRIRPKFRSRHPLLRPRRPRRANRRRHLHRICHPALLRLALRQTDCLGAHLARRHRARTARPRGHARGRSENNRAVLPANIVARGFSRRALQHRICRSAPGVASLSRGAPARRLGFGARRRGGGARTTSRNGGNNGMTQILTPALAREGVNRIIAVDRKLAKVVAARGAPDFPEKPEPPFHTLTVSVVNQLLSKKAAQTIEDPPGGNDAAPLRPGGGAQVDGGEVARRRTLRRKGAMPARTRPPI